jgi:hypothetical protein
MSLPGFGRLGIALPGGALAAFTSRNHSPGVDMLRRFVPLVALAVAVACGSDSNTQPTFATIAGTWNLQTVNGTPLPFTISQTANDKVEVVSDVVTATPTGTYTEVIQVRETLNGQATVTTVPDAGSYTINGSAITLSSPQSGSVTGTLSGNNDTFTAVEDGFVYVFTRQ